MPKTYQLPLNFLNKKSLWENIFFKFETLSPENFSDFLSDKIEKIQKEILNHKFNFEQNDYSRNLIKSPNKNSEIIIMNWNKKTKTDIHGHDDFCFYKVIKGELEMKIFDNLKSQKYLEEKTMQNPEFMFSYLKNAENNNFIHQIKTPEKAISFHFYGK